MGMLGGAGNASFTYKGLVYAMTVMFLLSTVLTIYADYTGYDGSSGESTTDQLLDDYYLFTGNDATKEAVWVLTGIYTPYYSGGYGYTEDGWLYGSRVQAYTPSQYEGTNQEYSVEYNDGTYVYSAATDYGDHAKGDLYTNVTMDVAQKSNVFFTTASRGEADGHFYYEYSGYRYAFQPTQDYSGVDADGNETTVEATTTSLSLIWYQYYTQSGISGQLVLSGSDSGVSYLTKQQILTGFDSITQASKFEMVFNGVQMNVYVKVDPSMLSLYTLEECFDLGYWSIMVSSLSTDANAYTGTDYSFNVFSIFETMISLFTFDMARYGFSGMIATLASIVFVMPLYSYLISVGLDNYPVLILAGILAAIQAVVALI